MIPVTPCGGLMAACLMMTLHTEQRLNTLWFIPNNAQWPLGVDDCTVLTCSRSKGKLRVNTRVVLYFKPGSPLFEHMSNVKGKFQVVCFGYSKT